MPLDAHLTSGVATSRRQRSRPPQRPRQRRRCLSRLRFPQKKRDSPNPKRTEPNASEPNKSRKEPNANGASEVLTPIFSAFFSGFFSGSTN